MASSKKKKAGKTKAVPAESLRWRCDADKLPFSSTADVKPAIGVVGQESAVEALRFGLESNAPGQNIFVRGITGTGRLTLVRRRLEEIRLHCPLVKDCCYVHNFQQPDRPKAITLPRGMGVEFQRRVDRLAHFIRENLPGALSSEGISARRAALDKAAKEQIDEIVKPFEKALIDAGFQLVSIQAGPMTQTAVFPMVNDKPVPPEEFMQLHAQGKITDEQVEAFRMHTEAFDAELSKINVEINKIRRAHADGMQALLEKSARWILGEMVREIEQHLPYPGVREFLGQLMDDVVEQHLDGDEESDDFTRRYRVNLPLDRSRDAACPIVAESTPSMRNLLGTIDYEFGPGDEFQSTHMGIRAGSLLQADGGYLILDARDLLSEPGAWKVLVRTLRTGLLEIAPMDTGLQRSGPSLKPEPIEIHVKVVLLGDTEIYYFLDSVEPDFAQLFKVLVDFDSEIPRNRSGVLKYAQVLARIAQDEQLPPFDRTAVAALVEHGARIAGRGNRLTTRFGRVADIAREAAFLAGKEDRTRVSGSHVLTAIKKGKQRADLPSRRFLGMVKERIIRIDTRGSVVGQINGLAVLQAGPLTYGFPARITATIGPGTAGVINIEREAALSGAIHTKGFYILSGLLRFLLRTDHPLAFDASVAFEQSYGGIDGDSASGAEICCLISALTDLPIRQDLAMTGAIDQVGHILAIGAVNEKIEGFFDVCSDLGLTGTQGVVIPKANARDLMLRRDVVKACEAGKFFVYPVDTVHQAIEILMDTPAGRRRRNNTYPEGTVLGRALLRARDYWKKAVMAQNGE